MSCRSLKDFLFFYLPSYLSVLQINKRLFFYPSTCLSCKSLKDILFFYLPSYLSELEVIKRITLQAIKKTFASQTTSLGCRPLKRPSPGNLPPLVVDHYKRPSANLPPLVVGHYETFSQSTSLGCSPLKKDLLQPIYIPSL